MKYEVIVGNVGTAYAGDDEQAAAEARKEYIAISRDGTSTRIAGESVTFMEDGHPVEEACHQGYMYLYEDYPEDDRATLIAERRARNGMQCPACAGGPVIVDKEMVSAVTEVFRDNDHRLYVGRRCDRCGFTWNDVYTLTGSLHI